MNRTPMPDEERQRLEQLARDVLRDLSAEGDTVDAEDAVDNQDSVGAKEAVDANSVNAEDADDFFQVLRALSSPGLDTTPESWKEEALSFLNADQTQPDRATRWIQSIGKRLEDAGNQLRGALVFDTALDAALPGLRGAGTSSARQILYAYPSGRLHLRLNEKDGKIEVRGRYLPVESWDVPEKRILEIQNEDDRSTSELDEDGQFVVPELEPGVWNLQLHWGELKLSLGPIQA